MCKTTQQGAVCAISHPLLLPRELLPPPPQIEESSQRKIEISYPTMVLGFNPVRVRHVTAWPGAGSAAPKLPCRCRCGARPRAAVGLHSKPQPSLPPAPRRTPAYKEPHSVTICNNLPLPAPTGTLINPQPWTATTVVVAASTSVLLPAAAPPPVIHVAVRTLPLLPLPAPGTRLAVTGRLHRVRP